MLKKLKYKQSRFPTSSPERLRKLEFNYRKPSYHYKWIKKAEKVQKGKCDLKYIPIF